MTCDKCTYRPLGSASENTVKIEHVAIDIHIVTTTAGIWYSSSIGILPVESASAS